MREYVCSLMGLNPVLTCAFSGSGIPANALVVMEKGLTYRVARSTGEDLPERILLRADCEMALSQELFAQQFRVEPDPPCGFVYLTADVPPDSSEPLYVYSTGERRIVDLPLGAAALCRPGELALVHRVLLPAGEAEGPDGIPAELRRKRFAVVTEDFEAAFRAGGLRLSLSVRFRRNQIFELRYSRGNRVIIDAGAVHISAECAWFAEHFDVLPACIDGYEYDDGNVLFRPAARPWRLYSQLKKRFITEQEEEQGAWEDESGDWVKVCPAGT